VARLSVLRFGLGFGLELGLELRLGLGVGIWYSGQGVKVICTKRSHGLIFKVYGKWKAELMHNVKKILKNIE